MCVCVCVCVCVTGIPTMKFCNACLRHCPWYNLDFISNKICLLLKNTHHTQPHSITNPSVVTFLIRDIIPSNPVYILNKCIYTYTCTRAQYIYIYIYMIGDSTVDFDV